jgi:branched-chain amino acid transport system permease protein
VISKKDNSPIFYLVFGLILLALAVLPYTMDLFFQTFITEILIWVLFALSFDLIFGYTGLLSFGQALFFGVGGYTVAILVLKLGWSTGNGLLLSIIVPMIFAVFVGYFSVKLTGIHFVIITLIFALIGSTIGETWSAVTGGADGLVFPVSPIQLGLFQIDLMDIKSNYYFVLVLVTLSYLLLRRIVQSPLGKVFIAIRENEDRARLIGYSVERY